MKTDVPFLGTNIIIANILDTIHIHRLQLH